MAKELVQIKNGKWKWSLVPLPYNNYNSLIVDLGGEIDGQSTVPVLSLSM